jgi:hypothetical protein
MSATTVFSSEFYNNPYQFWKGFSKIADPAIRLNFHNHLFLNDQIKLIATIEQDINYVLIHLLLLPL